MKVALVYLIPLLVFSTAYSSEEDDLRRLIDDYAKAVNRLDLDLAQSIWSQKEEISFIQPRGHQRGWKEIRQAFYLGAMAILAKETSKLRT